MNKFRVLTAILLGLVFSLPASEGDKQEIIKNGNFKKVAPFTKKIKKWNIIGDKMPVDWVPIFTYGNAETEVVSTSGDSPGHELRLKRGAVGQYLKVKPSPSERVMDISFELHGSKDSICLLRINSKDCLTVSKLTEVPHRYQAQYIVKPGEVVKRISFWCYSAVFTYIDKVSFKLAHSDDKSAEQVKKGDIPENAVTTTTWLKTGSNGIRLTLSFRDGGENKVSIHPFSQILSQVAKKDKVTTLTRLLPDAGLDVTGLQGNVRKFVRPNLELYKPNVQKNYIDKWESMPGAAECRFPLTFVRDNEWLRCYIDGQYAGRLTARGGLKTMVFSYSTDGEVEDIVTDTVELNRDFLALDLSRLKICGATAAKLELDKDKLPASLPLVVTPEKSLEINKTKNANKRYGRLIRSIFYTQRNAFYGADDSALFTVPSAQYVKAWALCATEPGKDTALTARLTRFVSGGNLGGRARECLADTTIELPTGSEKPGQGITQVGEVLLEGKKVPLWLVEIPLKSGDITDVLFYERGEKIKYFHSGGCYGTEVIFENGAKQRGILNFGPYLDFELTSRLIPFAHPFGDTRYLPDPNKKNGVRVFAVTLEKTPVEMEIKQTQPGNIFHNDEKPELTVLLRPLLDGNYQLRWQISDIDDQQVGSGHKNLTLQVKNGEVSVPVSLRQPRTGWYAIKIQLFKENRQLLEHNATFAQLGKDTRKAGYESPFATWWFGPSHYGTPDANIAGPMILKAGFRRAVIGASNRLSEKQLAPWKFTLASLGWPISQLKHGKDEDIVKGLNKKLKAYPHVNNAMIFHENAKNPYEQAPELIGLKPEKEDDPQADEKFKWAMRYAKILRDKFPDIKIFIGNSLACTELVAEMLRRGFPEKYADYVGNESVVRTWLPEKLGTNNVQSNWLLREIPRKFGYTKWGVTSCLEHDYRQVRLIGAQLQAEWYVRDALLGLMYGCPYIGMSMIYDEGNAYNGSFWGSVAMCQRYPLLYPHKSYVALATLTKTMDRVKFSQVVPTGSNSVYTVEFSRPDNKWIYAVWTSRGTCELDIKFVKNVSVEICDLYGRSREISTSGEKLDLKATTATQYLISPTRIKTISRGARTYPDDLPPQNPKIVNQMNDLGQWQLKLGEDALLEWNKFLPYRTFGKFALRQVEDPEKGKCLELELLVRDKELPALMSEYAVLKLKKPITLSGKPTTLGMWVKGNSGWGQVYWEIEDADGVRRISCGTTQHNADVFDYHGSVSINFDGWNFLRMPITDKSPVRDISTGDVTNLWNKAEKNREKSVKYPIKLTGIAVSLPSQALHLTEMRKLKQLLRFKDLIVYK